MEIASLLPAGFFRDRGTVIRELALYIGGKHLYTGVAQEDAAKVAHLFPDYSLAYERMSLSHFIIP